MKPNRKKKDHRDTDILFHLLVSLRDRPDRKFVINYDDETKKLGVEIRHQINPPGQPPTVLKHKKELGQVDLSFGPRALCSAIAELNKAMNEAVTSGYAKAKG